MPSLCSVIIIIKKLIKHNITIKHLYEDESREYNSKVFQKHASFANISHD